MLHNHVRQTVQWLRRAGMDVRPWDAVRWCILGPTPNTMRLFTCAELALLASKLERSFLPVTVVEVPTGASRN